MQFKWAGVQVVSHRLINILYILTQFSCTVHVYPSPGIILNLTKYSHIRTSCHFNILSYMFLLFCRPQGSAVRCMEEGKWPELQLQESLSERQKGKQLSLKTPFHHKRWQHDSDKLLFTVLFTRVWLKWWLISRHHIKPEQAGVQLNPYKEETAQICSFVREL